jgi:nucleoside-diphosphate-sugar epimerase
MAPAFPNTDRNRAASERVVRSKGAPIMHVMVAGATGAIGAGLVPLLAAKGHTVIGLTRSADKAEALKRLGAEPVVVDALDGAGVGAAALAARPEVIVHELTALKNATDIVHFDRAFAATNRLRTDGLDVLRRASAERDDSSLRASAAGLTHAKEDR